MKRILALFFCICLLTGCNGSREPEERDYVMVIAIDKNYDTYVSVARPNRDSSSEKKRVFGSECQDFRSVRLRRPDAGWGCRCGTGGDTPPCTCSAGRSAAGQRQGRRRLSSSRSR